MNVAHKILAVVGRSRDGGVVGPNASSGLGTLSSFETVIASLSMVIAPTSPLRTAMMIL